MNPFEFVLAILFMIFMFSLMKSRIDGRSKGRRRGVEEAESAETLRLRDEVKQLKERIHVLERIATDKEDTLSRQIEELRDR